MLEIQFEIKISKSTSSARRQGKVLAGHSEFLSDNNIVIRPNK